MFQANQQTFNGFQDDQDNYRPYDRSDFLSSFIYEEHIPRDRGHDHRKKQRMSQRNKKVLKRRTLNEIKHRLQALQQSKQHAINAINIFQAQIAQQQQQLSREINKLKQQISAIQIEKNIEKSPIQNLNQQISVLNSLKDLKMTQLNNIRQQVNNLRILAQQRRQVHQNQIGLLTAQKMMIQQQKTQQQLEQINNEANWSQIRQTIEQQIQKLTYARQQNQMKFMRQRNDYKLQNQIRMRQISELEHIIRQQQFDNERQIFQLQHLLVQKEQQWRRKVDQEKAKQTKRKQYIQTLKKEQKQIQTLLSSLKRQQSTDISEIKLNPNGGKIVFNYGQSLFKVFKKEAQKAVWIGILIKKGRQVFFTKNGVQLSQNQYKALPSRYHELKRKQLNDNKLVHYFPLSKVSLIRDLYKGIQYYSLRKTYYTNGQLIFTRMGWNLRAQQMQTLVDFINL